MQYRAGESAARAITSAHGSGTMSSEVATILIGVLGLVIACMVPAVSGLIGIVIKLWIDQARQATQIALLQEGAKAVQTIQEQRLINHLIVIERRIERKMKRLEQRLVALFHNQPMPPELPEDDDELEIAAATGTGWAG